LFLNFHRFTRYARMAFFRATALRPLPPDESQHEEGRCRDIHEDEQLDEAQARRLGGASQPIARLQRRLPPRQRRDRSELPAAEDP
jgi:hypothetical protein